MLLAMTIKRDENSKIYTPQADCSCTSLINTRDIAKNACD
jgi:hypothetical protein